MDGLRVAFDPSKRFVRLRGELPSGFVAFEFAIGEPGIFLEMVLDRAAFEEFCRAHQVIFLGEDRNKADDDSAPFDWRPSNAVQRGIGT